MSELTTTTPAVTADNPFAPRALAGHVSAGAVAIEQERAIAEAQGKLVIAKRFPRDQAAAYQRVMEACSRQGLAEEAIYSFPRGGENVTGPSIRLAEELARCWGNIDYGLRELSRRVGESEMEAYAWDLETNTSTSQKFTVKHVRDTRRGRQDLTDERDIYEIGANQGARRLRARLLAILPPDLVDAAVNRCRATLAGKTETPMADRIRALVDGFAAIGVTAALIERRVGKKLDQLLPDELVDLRAVYKSIKDGVGKASDYFSDAAPQDAQPTAPGARRPAVLAAVAATVAQADPEPPPFDTDTGEVLPAAAAAAEDDF
jgi:hypothetical protein